MPSTKSNICEEVSKSVQLPRRQGHRLSLLGAVSLLALTAAAPALAGQLGQTAFQNYDPNAAASIVAGPFALYSVGVNAVNSTQINLGLTEVGKKVTGYDLLAPSALNANLLSSIEPVVIGPGGKLYLLNGHHTFASLQRSIYGASNPTVYVNVVANYSNLSAAQFWAQMQASNYLLPLDNGVVQAIDPVTGAPIPAALSGMTNDPYRGLEYSILKNKNSVLFPNASNITGAIGSSKPGLDKTNAYYSDFIWANAYRYANNGLGLPYLTPGDILAATKWNLTGSNVTKLQANGSNVTVSQLPGYILPSSLTVSGVIDTATANGGALDGNGTFTGLRGLNLGSVTIGTPASTTGLVMQLGADLGGTVTLSGANTYAGGTTILAGTLIISSDANLGAASPTNPDITTIRTADNVRATNGVVFNSLSEGAGTLQINSAMTFNRPIGVGGETAIINPNGNTVTLTGPIISLDLNATGYPDLTVAKSGGGTVILAPTAGSNPYFYGNWIVSGGTLQASSDAALGNTSGPAAAIGQIVLDGGTFQAGASFSSVRSVSLTGGSTFDTNGVSTSFAGTLTDVQRTLTVKNGSTTQAGSVSFNSLNISGTNTTASTGATASLALAGGSKGVTLTLTNGIVRTDRSTLFIQPSATLGGTEKVLSSIGSVPSSGIAAPWIILDSGAGASSNPYDFVTYDTTNGYKKATYTKVGSGGSGGIRVAGSADIVEQTGNATLAASAQAYALKVDSGFTITATGQTLSLGAGGLIVSNSNISGGTLAFGSNEAMVYAKGNSNTISSTITGTNGLTLSGSGTLALSAASTGLSGIVNIDSGTLSLSAANALINASSINLSNVKNSPSAAILSLSASNSFASLNSAGSNSSINITGSGTVLTIGQTANSNAALNNLDSTLSSTITDTAVASGGTALVKAGSGLLDLSGGKLTLTAGSNVAVTGGTLRVAASVFTNTNNIVTSSGTEVQFAQNGGGIFAGNISGGGLVHLIGGTLQLTGLGNSYAGGTVVEQGSTLDLTTANVSSGNANIVNAGGLVVFDQATTGTYAGVISDGCQMQQSCSTKLSGSLVKDDSTGANSGNVTLAAAQTYTGGTFVEAGTLTLGVADAIASSSGVDLGRVGGGATATLVLAAANTLKGLMNEAGNTTSVQLAGNNLTLNVGDNLSFSYDGAIAGTGGLVKSGNGRQILSGTSSYIGPTTINGGVLSVNGSIASSSLLTVNAGGTLGGNGIVGTTLISGGTLAPGNSIGTLTVSGSLTLTAAATYMVEVSPTAADRTNVTGNASLGGTVATSFAAGTYTQQRYIILTANGGINGAFASVNSASAPAGFTPLLSYDASNVYLDLRYSLTQLKGLNQNQQNVANTLINSFNANGMRAAFGTLTADGLTRAAGETAVGAQPTTLNAMKLFMDTIGDPTAVGRDGFAQGTGAANYAAADDGQASAYADGPARSAKELQAYAMIGKAPALAVTAAPRWNVWAAGYGSSQSIDGNAWSGANKLTDSVYGVAVGADYHIAPNTMAGFALGGGGTNFSVSNIGGTGRSDLFQAGAWVRHTIGQAYVAATAAYGWQDVITDRIVATERPRGDYNINAYAGRLEGGYRFLAPVFGVGLTPYAMAQFTGFDVPAYVEQGAANNPDSFALSYRAKSVDAWRSELGVKTDRSYLWDSTVVTLRSRAAWVHNFDTATNAVASFQALPGTLFLVNGVSLPSEMALVSAAADVKWANGFSLSGQFQTELANSARSYQGKLIARYTW